MFEAIILGLAQGITEWLPISSDGVIVAIENIFFPSGATLSELLKEALFLHLGTFFAALIYFRKDVWNLTVSLFKFKESTEENKKILIFLVISTLVSGVLGFLLFKGLEEFESQIRIGTQFINLLVAVFLFVTAYVQLKVRKNGLRKEENLNTSDSVLLGLAQGVAVLPGLSRSGLTVSALLLKKFDDTTSLRLSFLMSLPIVFAGNIILILPEATFSTFSIVSLVVAFISGLLTIDLLFKLAKKINFGYFALVFGVLMVVSILI